VSLTYFYNAADENARAVNEALAALARRRPHLHLSAVDLDKNPAAARALGVRSYNTAVIEAAGRRVQVENTVDLRQVAFGLLRAENQREETVCFITGHGEPFDAAPPHVHYSHVETLQGHDVPGAGEVVLGTEDGLDRLRLALAAYGYAEKAIVPATLAAIPENCAVVADVGPRRAWAPGEGATLAAYLARGGRALLMADPGFPVGPDLQRMLGQLGIVLEDGTVIDPLNHYGTDPEKIAVPYYPPHPITDRIAMTVFPDARALHVAPAPDGVRVTPLFASSKDSYRRPAGHAGGDDEGARGEATLAAALQGRWPGSLEPATFRLVVVGNSAFASNAYFPIVSNGELATSMIRWLAGDTDTPTIQPQRFSLPEITLTHRSMQTVFLLVEVLLPLSVMLTGALVWWRRR
jgi:ABC-2 type transport system permease protein